jgi:hypothetical protein
MRRRASFAPLDATCALPASIAVAAREVNMPIRTASCWMLCALLMTAIVTPTLAAAPAECLHPAKVRGWKLLPDAHVLVDAGRERFVIELSGDCPGLGDNPFLGFISDRTDSLVCGIRGDRLVPHGSAAGSRPPCPIRQLRVVDDVEYANQLQRRVQVDSIGS